MSAAFLGIGKRLSSQQAVVDLLLLGRNKLTANQATELLTEYHAAGTDVVIRGIEGGDWFVGFKVACGESAEGLQDNVAEAAEAWEVMFPGQQARVVLTSIVS